MYVRSYGLIMTVRKVKSAIGCRLIYTQDILRQVSDSGRACRVAIIDPDGTCHTYGQIDVASSKLASQIFALVDRKGVTIAGYNLPSSMFVVRR